MRCGRGSSRFYPARTASGAAGGPITGRSWRASLGDSVRGRRGGDVPDDFGSWKTLWKRHDSWSGDGTWDRLLTEMCADADAVAELDWLVAVDSSINRAHQHAAGARRITDPTATRHRVGRVGRVGRVAYRRPDPATIPERADQLAHRARRGSKGGRPYAFDAERYKRRNIVERCFSRLKQWRGVATRYDKKAVNYRGGIVLASLIIWLKS